MTSQYNRNGIRIIKHNKKPRTSNSDPSRDKRLVALVARQKGLCFYCGKMCNLYDEHRFEHNYAATLDHVVPVKDGGETNYLNLVMCCNYCNGLKGGHKLLYFQQKYYPKGLAGMQDIDTANPIYPLMMKLLRSKSPDHPAPPYKP
jgi:5-methylcytosine-specific restriction endonuclease McrA